MKITLDFETRSRLSLDDHGSWAYSMHPSTDVLCLGWKIGHVGSTWRMGQSPPERLFLDIELAGEVAEAHNAFFEYCVWLNVCHRRYGWPAMPDEMWRCSAAKAAAVGLPRNLGDAGRALGLAVVKDEAMGKRALSKMSRPRKPTKADPTSEWHSDELTWQELLMYNSTDVLSEEALSNALPDLSERELEVWRMSERMNRRGFPVDLAGCRAAVWVANECKERLEEEFVGITGVNPTQRDRFKDWALEKCGIALQNTQADTLDEHLADRRLHVPQYRPLLRAMKIMREIGRSSIGKYQRLLDYAEVDGRAHGCFGYHVAHTGRWAANGPQPQNFKRESPWKMDILWDMILQRDMDLIDAVYDDPLEVLSCATRGAICAPPGRILYAGDFAQIEVRKLFWLAGEWDGLDAFRRDEDIYLMMASIIFNRKVEKKESEKRFLGKHAVLALGFGAGFVKFWMHCVELGAPEWSDAQVREVAGARYQEVLDWICGDGWDMVKRYVAEPTMWHARQLVLAKVVVDKYRARYKNTVVKLWKTAENAARHAIQNPGTWQGAGKFAYRMGRTFLACRLPSGRIMRYPHARVDPRGEISYMAWEKGQWLRTKTYGGKLTENVVQASSRDIMADGMSRLETRPEYRDIIMTVHDEVVSEADEGTGSIGEFCAVLAEPPAWCADIPIKVEGFVSRRYRK